MTKIFKKSKYNNYNPKMKKKILMMNHITLVLKAVMEVKTKVQNMKVMNEYIN